MFTEIDESTENKYVHQSEVQQARSFHAVLFVALDIHVIFHVYCTLKRTIEWETPLYEEKEKNSLEITVF